MTIKIEYFSDVLCIWAYASQVRIDELKQTFGDEIEVVCRYVHIFGAGKDQVAKNWKGEGKLKGFNQHLQNVAKNWDHVSIHPGLWTDVKPASCISTHLYLKAIQLLEIKDKVAYEKVVWEYRVAFFKHGMDISQRQVQDEIANSLSLPVNDIHQLIDSGDAFAELHKDELAKQKYNVPGSPTLVLNEGRQILYGNLGYRVIEANVRELMHHPDHGEANWC